MYDPQIEFPDPLVPSELTFGVAERVRADGTMLRRPDEQQVEALAAKLKAKGVVSRRHLLSQQLRQSGQRTRGRRAACRAAAGCILDAVVRGGAANPRISAHLDRCCQRLHDADLAALSARAERPPEARGLPQLAAHHAVLWRRHRRRDRGPQSGAHDRKRPRGRRARRLPLRRGARHRPADVVRHGRHHGQGLPDRGRRAADHRRVRSRPPLPLQGGQRPARPHPVDRHDRDRRGRRQHRPRRQSRPAQGRPGQRRLGTGPGLLRPRRHDADRDRRRPRARLCSTPTISSAAT